MQMTTGSNNRQSYLKSGFVCMGYQVHTRKPLVNRALTVPIWSPLSILTTAVDAVQDGFIKAQCFALKLTHDGSLPGEMSREGFFCFSSCAHEALALVGPELHLPLHPSNNAATPTATGQFREFSDPSLAAHLSIQTSTWSGNSFALCS